MLAVSEEKDGICDYGKGGSLDRGTKRGPPKMQQVQQKYGESR